MRLIFLILSILFLFSIKNFCDAKKTLRLTTDNADVCCDGTESNNDCDTCAENAICCDQDDLPCCTSEGEADCQDCIIQSDDQNENAEKPNCCSSDQDTNCVFCQCCTGINIPENCIYCTSPTNQNSNANNVNDGEYEGLSCFIFICLMDPTWDPFNSTAYFILILAIALLALVGWLVYRFFFRCPDCGKIHSPWGHSLTTETKSRSNYFSIPNKS